MQRGDIWWASLPEPTGSGPGYRRPVLVVQADAFNRSKIQTIIVAVVTSNLDLAAAPGNVRLSRRASKLARVSVVNVSQLLTLDRSLLTEHVGPVGTETMSDVDAGLRLVLGLGSG